ncbi:hypothetical protein HHI36_005820 [Cryptolaemus montrouzieri]|uniref:Carboxylesterase type B domain-containing protein n=1 Tax=Cryptolaemus montrouzieri TaxID=559131 RepID=A0ABD2NVH5_9CUCU
MCSDKNININNEGMISCYRVEKLGMTIKTILVKFSSEKQRELLLHKKLFVNTKRLGSVRGEDLIYILGMPLVGGHPFFPQNFTRQDMGISEALLNFFSNFAKCGDPNGCGSVNKDVPDYGTVKEKTRYKSISWDPYEVSTQFYLSISKYIALKDIFFI